MYDEHNFSFNFCFKFKKKKKCLPNVAHLHPSTGFLFPLSYQLITFTDYFFFFFLYFHFQNRLHIPFNVKLKRSVKQNISTILKNKKIF